MSFKYPCIISLLSQGTLICFFFPSHSPSVDSDKQLFCLTIASLFDAFMCLNRDVWRFFTLSCAVLWSQTPRLNEAAAMFHETRLCSAKQQLES